MKKPTKAERKSLAGVMAYLGIAPRQFESAARGKEKRKRQQARHLQEIRRAPR